jgi:hypothetical protein
MTGLGFSQAHRHCFTIVLDCFDRLARLQRLHDLAWQLGQGIILQPCGLQQQIEPCIDGNELRQPIFHADQAPSNKAIRRNKTSIRIDRNAVVSPIATLIGQDGQFYDRSYERQKPLDRQALADRALF